MKPELITCSNQVQKEAFKFQDKIHSHNGLVEKESLFIAFSLRSISKHRLLKKQIKMKETVRIVKNCIAEFISINGRLIRLFWLSLVLSDLGLQN